MQCYNIAESSYRSSNVFLIVIQIRIKKFECVLNAPLFCRESKVPLVMTWALRQFWYLFKEVVELLTELNSS